MAKARNLKPNSSMRARKLKPSIFANDELGLEATDPLLMILFQGLWCIADREGRLEDRPWKIKAKVFPLRNIPNPDEMLQWLADHQFIVRYEAEGGKFIQVLNFLEHQDIHPHEAASVIPAMSTDKEMSGDVMTCHDIGEPTFANVGELPSLTSYSSFPSLPSTTVPNGTGGKATDEITDPVERRIWTDGVQMLSKSGLSDRTARSLLGSKAKEFGKPLLAQCIAITQAENPADPKTFLLGTLKDRSGVTDPDADCSHCDNDRRVRVNDFTSPCPKCRPKEEAAYWKSRGKA